MKYAIAPILLAITTQSQANPITLDFGTDLWINNGSGSLAVNGSRLTVDDTDISSNIWVRIEHPIPLLPNLRLSQSDMDHAVAEITTANTTNMDTSYGDALAYYQILDNDIELDIGVGVKRFFGKIETTASGPTPDSGFYDVDNTLAIAYARGAMTIPLTVVQVSVALQQGKSGDDAISDANLMFRYISEYNVGVGIGYRYMSTELEVANAGNSANIDSNFRGLQVSLSFHIK